MTWFRMDWLLSTNSHYTAFRALDPATQEEYEAARWDFAVAMSLAHIVPVALLFTINTVLDCFPEYFTYWQQFDPNPLALLVSASARKHAIPTVRPTERRAALWTFLRVGAIWTLQHLLLVPVLYLYFDILMLKGPSPLFGPFPDTLTLISHMASCILIHQLLRPVYQTICRSAASVAVRVWKLHPRSLVDPVLLICPVIVECCMAEVWLWFFIHQLVKRSADHTKPLSSLWKIIGVRTPRTQSRDLEFLGHCQLHEVLFDFLPAEDVLCYRCLHSACYRVVGGYTRARLQDVFGQQLAPNYHNSLKVEVIDSPRGRTLQTIHAVLVRMLMVSGEDPGVILRAATGGVQTIATDLIAGRVNQRFVQLLLTSIAIESLQTVEYLGLNHISLTDGWLAAQPKRFPKLKHLNLRYARPITDDWIKAFAQSCPELESVNLGETEGITDASIELLASCCRQLKALDLSWSCSYPAYTWHAADRSMKALATHCLQLTVLHIQRTRVTDNSMKVLVTRCVQLQDLNIGECERISDKAITLLALNCRQLRLLDVHGTRGHITDASISIIATNCAELRSLIVCHTQGQISDKSIEIVARNCPKLEVLNVAGTHGAITDKSIALIALCCPALKSLDVCQNGNAITDEPLQVVGTHCLLLQSLAIGAADGAITDASMKLIATNCTDLRSFCISGPNHRIGAETITLLAMHCTQLRHIGMDWSAPLLTNESLILLQRNCRNLVEFGGGNSSRTSH